MTVPTADPTPPFGPPIDSMPSASTDPEMDMTGLTAAETQAQATADEQQAGLTGQSANSPPSHTKPDPIPVPETSPVTANSSDEIAPTTRTSFAGPHADIHTGVNYGTIIGLNIQTTVRIHRGEPLPKSWVDEQLAAYVPPRNEGAAADILYNERVLVLVADVMGSGRWTTALKLLRHAPGGRAKVKVVRSWL
ncbi:MAG TPA: hypothetical protein VMV07_02115 [Streptosporangiaceae bacterium]|nr:hypothetical protein [Streptosporangiaceae bacterium]